MRAKFFLLVPVFIRTPPENKLMEDGIVRNVRVRKRERDSTYLLFPWPFHSPGVHEIHSTTGNHGLMVKVRVENRAEISEFVEDRVSTYQGVKDVNITMTMETYKEDLLDI